MNDETTYYIDPLWNLHDELSVDHAAALIAGYDPGSVARSKQANNDGGESQELFERGVTEARFPRLYPAHTAVVNAINSGRLKAMLKVSARLYGYADYLEDIYRMEMAFEMPMSEESGDDEQISNDKSFFYKPFPDWGLSTVKRVELVEWLSEQGIRSGFFFPNAKPSADPDYLDPNHPRYAPKLAASVKVWLAMDDENLRRGKGTIVAMEQWLESRYKELGLVHEKDNKNNGTKSGDMNNSAISEAAKVANWQYGGSPKTPV